MRPARVVATRPSFGRNDMNDPPELCKPSIAGAPATGLLQADVTAGQGPRRQTPRLRRFIRMAGFVVPVDGAKPGPVDSRAATASEVPAPSPSRLSMR